MLSLTESGAEHEWSVAEPWLDGVAQHFVRSRDSDVAHEDINLFSQLGTLLASALWNQLLQFAGEWEADEWAEDKVNYRRKYKNIVFNIQIRTLFESEI